MNLQIGYEFSDPQLLKQALSHRSYHASNNERLEFLGDAILGFCIAEVLYHQFPNLGEGKLTRMRSRLVRRETLADIARELSLGRFLLLGQGEYRSGGFDRDSILADAMEAILGAVYIDGGIVPAKELVDRLFMTRIESLDASTLTKDPKTRLQEWVQQHDIELPEYQVVQAEGPAHATHFTVSCRLNSLDKTYLGEGKSRRKAEQAAARNAFQDISRSAENNTREQADNRET